MFKYYMYYYCIIKCIIVNVLLLNIGLIICEGQSNAWSTRPRVNDESHKQQTSGPNGPQCRTRQGNASLRATTSTLQRKGGCGCEASHRAIDMYQSKVWWDAN
jgi:hypothetical protein